jgi:hypothetical protein
MRSSRPREMSVPTLRDVRRAAADAKAHRPIWRLSSWLYRQNRHRHFNRNNPQARQRQAPAPVAARTGCGGRLSAAGWPDCTRWHPRRVACPRLGVGMSCSGYPRSQALAWDRTSSKLPLRFSTVGGVSLTPSALRVARRDRIGPRVTPRQCIGTGFFRSAGHFRSILRRRALFSPLPLRERGWG